MLSIGIQIANSFQQYTVCTPSRIVGGPVSIFRLHLAIWGELGWVRRQFEVGELVVLGGAVAMSGGVSSL